MFTLPPIARTQITDVALLFALDAAPTGRSTTNNLIYRYNGSSIMQDSMRMMTASWQSSSSAPIPATGASLNNVAYLFSNAAENNGGFSVGAYDGYTFTLGSSTSYVTMGTAAVNVGSKIMIITGSGGLSVPSYLYDGTAFTAGSGSVGSTNERTLNAGCAFLPNIGLVYTFGGETDLSFSAHNKIFSLNPTSGSGGTTAFTLSSAKSKSAASALGTSIKIFGGYRFDGSSSTTTLFNTIESFNGGSRTTDAATLSSNYSSICSTVVGSNIMLFGGASGTAGNYVGTVSQYNGTTLSSASVALPYYMRSDADVAVTLQLPNGTV